ncbi:40S ribosomal protein S17 [Mortierella hygrophila]|uniref:40S ribosomal protein S17 n=1 Tax=Mortierella hygrophila TaxID=979708 RepID=A0A9P6FD01_9FUNG|nr:40S ribosomal protein S17 [Mortierella hygrophila]
MDCIFSGARHGCLIVRTTADEIMLVGTLLSAHVGYVGGMVISKDSPVGYHPNGADGRVRTKTVKRASKVLIEKYYPRLTLDFQTNKKIASEVAIIPSKRLRNKIAGFTTHLMKRIQRGPVRGISFKLQEEERERKDNYIPEFSALDTSAIEIDTDTQALLKSLNFEELAGVTAVEIKQAPVDTFRKPRGDRKERA